MVQLVQWKELQLFILFDSLVKMQKNNPWQGRPRWRALKTFKWVTQTFATKEEGLVVKLGIESMATTKLRVAIRQHGKPYRKKS